MWLRLLRNYRTSHGNEQHFARSNIGKIKEGAPIEVRLDFTEKKEVKPRFIFSGTGELKYLDLSWLELPGSCVKDHFGNAFCAGKNMFFKANIALFGDYVARQLHYCPLCGKKLKQQPHFPKKEKLKTFTEAFPPIDDSILSGLDKSCGRQ